MSGFTERLIFEVSFNKITRKDFILLDNPAHSDFVALVNFKKEIAKWSW